MNSCLEAIIHIIVAVIPLLASLLSSIQQNHRTFNTLHRKKTGASSAA